MQNERIGMGFFISLVLGSGIGFLIGHLEFGGFLGLGAGLLMIALFRHK